LSASLQQLEISKREPQAPLSLLLSASQQQLEISKSEQQVPLSLLQGQSTLPAEDLNAALTLWLADALRLLPGEAKSWPRSRGDALLRLRARLHELKPEQREQTIKQLAAQLHIRLTQSADTRAISDLDWLPRLLASPRLPARLADYIERFLADATPSAAWRRKLARQLRLWSEDRSNPDDFSWENEARAQLAQWQSRLKTLPPSAIQSAALRACAVAPLADRKQLAAAFYALEKLVPTLLNAYPTLATSPHLLAQLRRYRLKLWRGSVADWLPLADTLAAQTANPDGLPGLWPDILQQTPEQISQTLADQHDPSLARLWQASRAAQRPLRGEERHQWQSVAAEIQQQLLQNQLGDDSRFLSEDAGMVLLWPFLPELFSRCGWTTANGRWQNPEAQLKAWRALATLAGRSEDDEQGHSTRMLVGLEIDEPVAHAPQLSESEFEHLITASAAIKNAWASAISPMPFRTGLRPLFLRRNGIWRTSQSGWQITVQTAAQDILLAKLPWSLSIIMLPWLDQLITIDWPRPSLPHSPTAAES
ncbi:MAG: hypothetical protein K2Q15_07540, partial [Burkholderiales bacterium]|nr:hypothetical protein [Burkholderiales bacterium]